MKFFTTIFTLFILAGCQISSIDSIEMNSRFSFFIGTYTNSESRGIYRCLLREDGSLDSIGLSAAIDNPSFIARSADKRFLVSISEVSSADKEGSVVSYLIEGDTLKYISKTTSGDAHPCFVTINEDGYVLSANYTGGSVSLVRLNDRGELSGLLDLQQHTGSGTTERQRDPHPHSVWFDPNSNGIISVDLGTNELWFSYLDTGINKLVPADPQKLSMAPGAGPRHLVFHPNGNWIYVVNELDCTVTLVKRTDSFSFEKRESISTLPAGYTESNTCADIHISSDGKFVYASNRGHNSIAIFEVNQTDGTLIPIGHESTHGSWPRNFSLSPDDKYLLVANQKTNNIVSYQRNSDTGLLVYTDEIIAPSPVCILFP